MHPRIRRQSNNNAIQLSNCRDVGPTQLNDFRICFFKLDVYFIADWLGHDFGSRARVNKVVVNIVVEKFKIREERRGRTFRVCVCGIYDGLQINHVPGLA